MVSFNKPHYRNLRAKYKRAGRLFIKSLNLAGLFPIFPRQTHAQYRDPAQNQNDPADRRQAERLMEDDRADDGRRDRLDRGEDRSPARRHALEALRVEDIGQKACQQRHGQRPRDQPRLRGERPGDQAPAGQRRAAERAEDEGVERDRPRAVAAVDRTAAEDRIQRVPEARAEAEQQPPQPEPLRRAHARHQHAARQAQNQRCQLRPRQLFPEEHDAHQHDEHRRGIEKHSHDREARSLHPRKIAPGKQHQAADPTAREAPDIARAEPQLLPVEQQQIQPDEDRARQHPQLHHIDGVEPGGVQLPDKQAHAAPEDPRQQHTSSRFPGFHIVLSFSF